MSAKTLFPNKVHLQVLGFRLERIFWLGCGGGAHNSTHNALYSSFPLSFLDVISVSCSVTWVCGGRWGGGPEADRGGLEAEQV